MYLNIEGSMIGSMSLMILEHTLEHTCMLNMIFSSRWLYHGRIPGKYLVCHNVYGRDDLGPEYDADDLGIMRMTQQ